MEPFSKLYKAVAYSRRYHYPNAGPGDSLDYSVDLHAKDLASLVRGLRLQRPHIVGSSFGAYIALVLTAEHPELVRSLPSESLRSFLGWRTSKKVHLSWQLLRRMLGTPQREHSREGDMNEGVRAFINGVLGQEAFDKLPISIRAAMMENAPEMKAEVLSPGYFSSHQV